jgi:hypothetical protein
MFSSVPWSPMLYHSSSSQPTDSAPVNGVYSANEVHVDFVVNKESLVESLLFFPVSVIPPVLISHSFACHRLCAPRTLHMRVPLDSTMCLVRAICKH